MVCYSDDVFWLLMDVSMDECVVLGNLCYQDNYMILYCDEVQMFMWWVCWLFWVYKVDLVDECVEIGVIYWMNKLQNICEDDLMFVFFNLVIFVCEELIYDQKMFRYLVFDGVVLKVQCVIVDMQGMCNIWFVGVYLWYGFYEDGFVSVMCVVWVMILQKMVMVV